MGNRGSASLVALLALAVSLVLGGAVVVTSNDDDAGAQVATGSGSATTAADGHDHEHEAAEPGHESHDMSGDVAREDRCDLGFNTATFNKTAKAEARHGGHDDTGGVDFTLEEWAEVFVDEEKIGVPVDAVVGFIKGKPELEGGILSGALTHSLTPDPWMPIVDDEVCEQLADELRRAQEVAATYPTVADAEKAGYRKVTQYYPGIAAHYIKGEYIDGEFVLEEPEMLLFDGTTPTSSMVGLSYYIVKEGDEPPPPAFAGGQDGFHRHVGLCFKDGVVAGGSNLTEEQCAANGGRKSDGSAGWMNHVWVVPGCESDWGVFSGANPALKTRMLGAEDQIPSGCWTGKKVTDQLAFDDSGDGPRL